MLCIMASQSSVTDTDTHSNNESMDEDWLSIAKLLAPEVQSLVSGTVDDAFKENDKKIENLEKELFDLKMTVKNADSKLKQLEDKRKNEKESIQLQLSNNNSGICSLPDFWEGGIQIKLEKDSEEETDFMENIYTSSNQEMNDNSDEELTVLPDALIPTLELKTGVGCPITHPEFFSDESAVIAMTVRSNLEKLKRIFHCEICASGFSSKNTLKKHIKFVHKKVRPFSCGECEKAFGVRKDLKRHMNSVHLKAKDNSCGECNIIFACNQDLKMHLETMHLNLKPFKCIYCSACFAQKGNLTMHTNAVHLKLKPFKCDLCDACFATKNMLRKHISSVHEKIKPFKCESCEKSFTQKTDMTRHVATVHLNLRTFQCPECSSAFAFKRYLNRHFERVHLRQYKCCKCDLVFSKKCDLRAHSKTQSHINTKRKNS